MTAKWARTLAVLAGSAPTWSNSHRPHKPPSTIGTGYSLFAAAPQQAKSRSLLVEVPKVQIAVCRGIAGSDPAFGC